MFKHYKYNAYIALEYTVNKSGGSTSTYYDWECNSYKCKLILEFPDSDQILRAYWPLVMCFPEMMTNKSQLRLKKKKKSQHSGVVCKNVF